MSTVLLLLATGAWTILLAANRRLFPYMLIVVAGLEYFSPTDPNSALTIPKAGLAALVLSQAVTGRLRLTMRRRGLLLSLAVFTGYMVMTVAWSANPERSLVRATSLVLLFAMCVVVQSSIRSLDDVRRYWRAFVVYALANALMIGYQLATGAGVFVEAVGARAGGLAKNPTEGAFYLSIAFVVLLIHHLGADRRPNLLRSPAFRLGALGVLAIGILMTGSRGGMLALMVGLVATASVTPIRKRLGPRWLAGYAVIGLFVLAFTWIVPQVRQMLWYRTTTVSEDQMGNRVVIWRNMWTLVKQRPVTGHGIQGTDIASDEVGRYTTTSSHNTPYGVLLDGGIIGLALFAAVGANLRRVLRQLRAASEAGIRLNGQAMTVLAATSGLFMLSHDLLFNKFLWIVLAMIESVALLAFQTSRAPTAPPHALPPSQRPRRSHPALTPR